MEKVVEGRVRQLPRLLVIDLTPGGSGGSSYSVVLDLGHGPDGKHIRKRHSGYQTRKDAERAQVELLAALGRGTYGGTVQAHHGRFLREDWLPGLRAQVRPGTWQSINPRLRFTSSRPLAGYHSSASPPAT